MKKLLTAIACTALAILTLAACNGGDSDKGNETTAPTADWRNTIAYDGSFYVNKKTKILYSLDTGTITLWDNKGNGAPLQKLKYDTYCDDVFDSIAFDDINKDGNLDITINYSDDGTNVRKNLWTWQADKNQFMENRLYKTIYNPVISEDGKTVSGMKNLGIFGTLEMQFNFLEDGNFVEGMVDISDAADVAAALSAEFAGGAPVEKADGKITLDEIECSVYRATSGGTDVAYMAYTSEGQWYIDPGCMGAYRTLSDNSGTFELGSYADAAGEAYELCAKKYKIESGELSIVKTETGSLSGSDAKAFFFELDGEELCSIVWCTTKAWYGNDSTVDGYYIISAVGEPDFIMDTRYEFTPIYDMPGAEGSESTEE